MSSARYFLKTSFLACITVTFSNVPNSVFGQQNQTPNIVFILVDDLGWSDLDYMGSAVYETPNVDRLANQGMRFTDFYSAGPVCSPTRASILTGKNPVTTGITTYLISPDQDDDYMSHHLELSEYTLAESLRDNGYITALFGKWHLGYSQEHWATNQGFDIAVGGVASHNSWKGAYPDRPLPFPDKHLGTYYFSPYYSTHMSDGPVGEYLTDRLTDETMRFIEQHKNRPFFAFLSFHTVHTPLVTKRETEAKFRKKINELGTLENDEMYNGSRKYQNLPEYAAMVQHMDENVGRLLEKIDRLGISDNTIVVFTSDNGGKHTVTSNLPLRGGKHNLYEGGIRVPLIVKWPGKIKPETVSDEPLISDDFYATLLDLIGLPVPSRQGGTSFKDVLFGEHKIDRSVLYWHYPHGVMQGAVRIGEYKLLYHYKTGKAELYNLHTDLGERNDISKVETQRTNNMKKLLGNWLKDNDARFPKEELILT